MVRHLSVVEEPEKGISRRGDQARVLFTLRVATAPGQQPLWEAGLAGQVADW